MMMDFVRYKHVVRIGRGLHHIIKARKTAGTSKQIEVEVDKPLGLTLGPKPGAAGGVVITAVDGSGNAAKAGLKAGDQVIYTSSFFGDENWPADKLGFTKTAIQPKPDSVYFVVSRFPFLLSHANHKSDGTGMLNSIDQIPFPCLAETF